MTQAIFSAGIMYGIRTDSSGTSPEEFGLLQNVSIDFNREIKTLHGENQFPALCATGMATIQGRAAHGRIFGSLYADIFFGEEIATGGLVVAHNEAHTVTTGGATVANAADFTDDLGVYLTTGERLTKVATTPAALQYSVTAGGVYAFNTAQEAAAVKISYLYESTTGKRVTINNHFMGVTPSFKLVLMNPGRTQFEAAPFSLVLNACTSGKLTFPTRIGEFALPEFEFQGYADQNDVLGYLSTTE
jgi:hypothetical protein